MPPEHSRLYCYLSLYTRFDRTTDRLNEQANEWTNEPNGLTLGTGAATRRRRRSGGEGNAAARARAGAGAEAEGGVSGADKGEALADHFLSLQASLDESGEEETAGGGGGEDTKVRGVRSHSMCMFAFRLRTKRGVVLQVEFERHYILKPILNYACNCLKPDAFQAQLMGQPMGSTCTTPPGQRVYMYRYTWLWWCMYFHIPHPALCRAHVP